MDKRKTAADHPSELSHELWLIYSRLKDAERLSDTRLEILRNVREDLGLLINTLHQISAQHL